MKITKLSRRQTQIIVITAGLILFLITIVYSVKTDIKAVARQMDETLKYVKEQCYIYNRYNEASQTKGLMRAIENAQQVNRNLTYIKDEVTEDKLKTYAEEQRLTGIIILDANGKVKCEYSTDDLNSWALQDEIQKKTVLDVAAHPRKTYAASIVLEDGSQVDLAAYGRSDEKGIIITFYHTSAEYARNYNLTVQSLLSGYDTYSSGMIVVTNGKNVVASNDEDLIGQSSGDINIIQQVKQKPANKLVRVSDKKCRYIGRMTKGRDYYVYMFIDEQMAFASVFKNLLVVLLLYIFVAASVFAFRRRSKAQLLKIQMMQEEAYKQKLLQEAQRADMANNAKTEFLQRMSHDIRTPINGIRGMIEVADYYKDDLKKQDECRRKIWDASGYLLELINEVLDMSKLESEEIVLENKDFDINKLLHEIREVIEKQVYERGISLSEKEYNLEYRYLNGSPVHLKRILMNIISNAVKYNKEKGEILLSYYETQVDDRHILFEFHCKDTGVGMSKEFQNYIFEPFTQETGGARSVYGGTGLGMPITKKLIEKMGGTIKFESEKNVGTTFMVQLPFLISADMKQAESQEDDVSIEGMKILLAEDNELNMEIAEFLLTNAGAEIIKASNGKEAVEAFAKSGVGEINVILMDIMMPVMDGLEATREIRTMNRSDASAVVIIAMTANAFTEDKTKALKSGMDDYLTKPLESEKLIRALSRYKHN